MFHSDIIQTGEILLVVCHPSIYPSIHLFVCLFVYSTNIYWVLTTCQTVCHFQRIQWWKTNCRRRVNCLPCLYTCISGHLIGLGVCLNDDKYIVKEKNRAKKEMQGLYHRSRNKQTKTFISVFKKIKWVAWAEVMKNREMKRLFHVTACKLHLLRITGFTLSLKPYLLCFSILFALDRFWWDDWMSHILSTYLR